MVRNAGLALFAAFLVAVAMAQDVTLTQTPRAEEPSSGGEVLPAVPAEQTQSQEPAMLVVPDVEGLPYREALETLEMAGFEVMVFDATSHAAAPAGFAPSSADAYITATSPEAGEPSEDGTVAIAVSWDRTGLPDAARRDPWWWPGHDTALSGQGAPACSQCHEDTHCTTCHVNRAHLYLQPGDEAPDASTPVSLGRSDLESAREAASDALQSAGGSARLEGIAGGAGGGVLIDVRSAGDAAAEARVVAALAPAVFDAVGPARSMTVRFFGESERLPHVTVTFTRTTARSVEWVDLDAGSLEDLADDYTRTR